MVGVCRGKLILIGLSRGSWLPLLSERAAPTNPVEPEAPRMCLSFHRRLALGHERPKHAELDENEIEKVYGWEGEAVAGGGR